MRCINSVIRSRSRGEELKLTYAVLDQGLGRETWKGTWASKHGGCSLILLRYSFFINTTFLWNSIPKDILQITNHPVFRSELRRFLFCCLNVFVCYFCMCLMVLASCSYLCGEHIMLFVYPHKNWLSVSFVMKLPTRTQSTDQVLYPPLITDTMIHNCSSNQISADDKE